MYRPLQAGSTHSANYEREDLNLLTLCPQHGTEVSKWICICEKVCVSGCHASQYRSTRVRIKGCDVLGKKDSRSGPRQTKYFSQPDLHEVLLSLSLCLHTSSPSNIPALHRKCEIRRRERRKMGHSTHKVGGGKEHWDMPEHDTHTHKVHT